MGDPLPKAVIRILSELYTKGENKTSMVKKQGMVSDEIVFFENFAGMLNFLENSSELSPLQKHTVLIHLRLILEENRSWLPGTVTRPLSLRTMELGSSKSFQIRSKSENA